MSEGRWTKLFVIAVLVGGVVICVVHGPTLFFMPRPLYYF